MASSLSNSNVSPPPIAGQTVQPEDKFTSFIERRLRLTGNHVKLVDLFGGLMMLCGFVLGSLLLLCVVDSWVFELSAALRIIALLSILVVSGGYFIIQLLPLLIKRINPAYAAKMIEDGHPEFKNSLLNHVFFKRDPRGAKAIVAGAVHRKAAEDISHITIETAVDRGFLIRAGYFFAAMLALFGLYKILSPKDPFTTVARIVAPFAEISRPSRVQIDEIKPGDVEIFFGERLTVEAKVNGVGDDELINLVFSSEDGQIVDRHLLMKRDEDKKSYSSNLSSSDGGVQQNLTYWIKAGDGESRRFKVIVKPRPSFVVQSVKIAPPEYTKLESYELQQGNLASVEGASVTVHALANLPIDVAFIQLLALPESDGQRPADSAIATPAVEPKFVESVSMQVTNETEAVGKFWLQMQSDRLTPSYTHYRVGFLTKDGLPNENATVYRIQTTPDLKPEIELVQPRETISRLPENRKARIQVQAFDPDYQITDIRLVGDRRGSHLFEKSILKENAQSDGQIDVDYQFDPRDFGLRSGDEVLIHALALDNRHAPISDVIDPNVVKSKQIRFQIIPAAEDPAGSDSSATDDSRQRDPQSQDQSQNQNQNQNQSQTDKSNPPENQQTKSDRNDNSKTDANDQKQDADASKDGDKSDGNSKENSKSDTQQKDDQSKSGESKQQESGGGGSKSESSQQDSAQSKSDGSESGNQSSGEQSKKGNQPNQGLGDGKSNQSDSSQNSGQNDGNSSNSSPAGNDSSQSKPNGGQSNQQNVDQQRPGSTENGTNDSADPVDHPGDAFERIKKHVEQTKKSDQGSRGSQDKKSDAAATDNRQQKSGAKPDEATDGNSQSKPDDDKRDGSQKEESRQEGSNKDDTNAKEGGSKQEGTKQEDSKQNGSKQAGSKKDNSKSSTGGTKQDNSKAKDRDDNQPNVSGIDENSQNKEGSDQEGVTEGNSKKEGADKGADKEGDAKSGSEQSDFGRSDEKNAAAGKDGDAHRDSSNKTGKQDSGEGTGDEKSGDESSKEEGSQETGDKNGGKKGQDQNEENEQVKSDSDQAKSGKSKGSPQNGKKQQESTNQESDSGEQGGDSTNQKTGQQKNDDSNRDNKSTDGASKPGGGNGNRQRSDNDTNDAAEETPDGDAANLEYARKATDLVLDYLKDHKDDADNELLDDLNWSPEEMRHFYEKWEQMRKAAEQGSATERKRYEEALRSLGLRPGREGVESENIQQQKIEGLLEKGNRSQPPAHLLEEFRSFNKGRSRASDR